MTETEIMTGIETGIETGIVTGIATGTGTGTETETESGTESGIAIETATESLTKRHSVAPRGGGDARVRRPRPTRGAAAALKNGENSRDRIERSMHTVTIVLSH